MRSAITRLRWRYENERGQVPRHFTDELEQSEPALVMGSLDDETDDRCSGYSRSTSRWRLICDESSRLRTINSDVEHVADQCEDLFLGVKCCRSFQRAISMMPEFRNNATTLRRVLKWHPHELTVIRTNVLEATGA
jgi:hypothetical protein